jgi:hypothetical protein
MPWKFASDSGRDTFADRLCIIQDDYINIKDQIDAMGAIYSAATLVLVLVSGTSYERQDSLVYEGTVKVLKPTYRILFIFIAVHGRRSVHGLPCPCSPARDPTQFAG